MAIKPGLSRKPSNKNPPFFSHEFVIQNHADIVSCVAMVFVVGLMIQATSSVASIFVALHHNLTGADPSQENPRGIPYTYTTGWKDWCAVFFYTLISIIIHAVIQEYVIDKITKRLHLSKFKLQRFTESFQLIVFYALSFLWGLDVILREGYLTDVKSTWIGYPSHPMIFLHKLFFIIQLAYYLHLLPELYFQKVKKEEQQQKIIFSVLSFSIVALSYFWGFQRIALVMLTLHYFNEFIAHTFVMLEVFDRDEKFKNLKICYTLSFGITRCGTMVLAVLGLFYGLQNSAYSNRGLIALFFLSALQGHLVFQFLKDMFSSKRAAAQQAEQSQGKKSKSTRVEKSKKDRKRESDLPEADQQEVVAVAAAAVATPIKKSDNKKSK